MNLNMNVHHYDGDQTAHPTGIALERTLTTLAKIEKKNIFPSKVHSCSLKSWQPYNQWSPALKLTK